MKKNKEMKDNKVMKWSAKKPECNGIVNCLPLDSKNGIKLTPPQGCEVDKVEVVDGMLSVTFKAAERKLPKSWEEFCEMFPIKDGECYIGLSSNIVEIDEPLDKRLPEEDCNVLPDYATAEAVLALCQLIQLRNAYNGDWVPDWEDTQTKKFVISFVQGAIFPFATTNKRETLHFRTEELSDEFLRNFRPLIEKLKPLYGIKEGGEE